jgi:hypothetical protein
MPDLAPVNYVSVNYAIGVRQAFRRLRLIWVPEAQFQALPRPVPGMENPKRLILLGGGLLSTSLGPEFGSLRELL